MKKARKGFTLVELLAVIVILAVISLIATPMILGVIETAKKGAAESSALGYIDAVEKYIVMSELDSTNHYKLEVGKRYYVISDSNIEDLVFNFIPGVKAENLPENVFLNDILDIKGEYPIDGYVQIGINNNVEEAQLITNGYIVECLKDKCQAKNKYNYVIIPVEEIEIKNDVLEVTEEQTLQLEVEITPNDATNKKLIYTSSDESIATVDSTGEVTGVSPGSVTITITSKNGIQKSIDLIVKEKPLFYSYGDNPLPEAGYDNNNSTYVGGNGVTKTYTLGIDERLIGRNLQVVNSYTVDAYSWVGITACDENGRELGSIGVSKWSFTTGQIPSGTKYLNVIIEANVVFFDISY